MSGVPKAERMFRLVLLLRRGRVVTARELAEELEVSERTVYRDVQALILSGIPVEGEAGVGYIVRRGLDIPPLMFTADEARALALGARMVRAWGDPGLEQAARTVLEKVWAVATEKVRRDLEDPTISVPGFHLQPEVRENLGRLRRAIDERKKVRISYTRADGDTSARTIRPLGLFFWGRVWSVGAWCELRTDFRNFRMDRITQLKPLKTAFPDTSEISLDAFIQAVERT